MPFCRLKFYQEQRSGSQSDLIQDGEVHEAGTGPALRGEGVAVQAEPVAALAPRVLLLHHVRVARVGAEGAHLVREQELRVVVVAHDRVVRLARLEAQAHVHDVVHVGDADPVHQRLEEREAPSARRHHERLVGNLTPVGDGHALLGPHVEQCLAQRHRGPQVRDCLQQLVREMHAAVGAEVGLPDRKQPHTEPLGPARVHLHVAGRQDARHQVRSRLAEEGRRLLRGPVLLGEADGEREVHLAVVAQPAGADPGTVDGRDRKVAAGGEQRKDGAQPRGTRAGHENVDAVCHCDATPPRSRLREPVHGEVVPRRARTEDARREVRDVHAVREELRLDAERGVLREHAAACSLPAVEEVAAVELEGRQRGPDLHAPARPGGPGPGRRGQGPPPSGPRSCSDRTRPRPGRCHGRSPSAW